MTEEQKLELRSTVSFLSTQANTKHTADRLKAKFPSVFEEKPETKERIFKVQYNDCIGIKYPINFDSEWLSHCIKSQNYKTIENVSVSEIKPSGWTDDEMIEWMNYNMSESIPSVVSEKKLKNAIEKQNPKSAEDMNLSVSEIKPFWTDKDEEMLRSVISDRVFISDQSRENILSDFKKLKNKS